MFEIKKDPLVVALFTLLVIGLGVLCFLKVITPLQLLAGIGVLAAPSVFGRKKDDQGGGSSMGPPAAALLLVGSVLGCGVTPKQASDGAQAACTLVEAYADSAAVDSICATAPELAAIAAAAAEARAAARDAGARSAAPCRRIPGTETCATEAEIAAGIRAVKAKR